MRARSLFPDEFGIDVERIFEGGGGGVMRFESVPRRLEVAPRSPVAAPPLPPVERVIRIRRGA
jgi:hypothetical protein